MTDRAKKLLAELADYLETVVKDEWFDMRNWAGDGWRELQCGTTACAAGWATVLFKGKSFKHHLLKLESASANDPSCEGDDLVFGVCTGFDAAGAYFDIDTHASSWLFSEIDYDLGEDDEDPNDRMLVVRRLREAVETGVMPWKNRTKPIDEWEGLQP